MVGGEVSTPGLCQHKGKQMDLNCLQLQFHSVLNAHGVMQKPRPAEVEGAPGDGLVQPFALSRVTQRWLPRMMSSWSLSIFKDGNSTTSPGKLLLCSTTLTAIKLFLMF